MTEDPAEAPPSQIGKQTGTGEPPYPSEPYAWYVVGVLTVFYVLSFLDRQIIALMVEPMKADLGLSDLQMSYLGGLSFVIFYTLFGIFMGRLADHYNRRGIIAAGVFLWSLTTSLCGAASRFWQLLVLRMGVGVGEAALSPAAYSLIADYFPRRKLATALSVYSMGIYFGTGLAFTAGAYLYDWAATLVETAGGEPLPLFGSLRPWQIVFFAVGLPGMFLTALLLTVKEPLRRGTLRQNVTAGPRQAAKVPVSEVLKYMRLNWKTLLCHNVGIAFLSLAAYSGGFWDVAFFERTHGWKLFESGPWYGIVTMIAGALGVLFGGRLGDHLRIRGCPGANMLAVLIAAVAWLPFGLAYPLMPTPELSLALLFPALFAGAMPFGCAAAAIQEMMPPQMRGQASALYLFAINIIGLGLGPTAVAFLTESVFQDLEMLKFSLVCTGGAAHLLSGVILWLSLKPFQETLRCAQDWEIEHV